MSHPTQPTDDPSLAGGSRFDAFYGLQDIRVDADRATGVLAVREHHFQPTGVVHGGVYASVVEALASFLANYSVVPEGQIALGMSNATSFLRPCRGGHLHGEARPVHRGRTTWVCDVTVHDDDGRLCASGRVMLAVRPGEPAA